jgi:hypothetical protein
MKGRPTFVWAFVVVVGGLLPAAVFADSTGRAANGQGQAEVMDTVQPLMAPYSGDPLSSGHNKDLLAIQWRHRLNEAHSLALAAGYGDDVYLDEKRYDPVSAMASVGWTGQWGGRWRPAVSGSVFVGDENTPTEAYRNFDRRYFGFSVGGRMTFFDKHSPFVSFRMLRNESGNGEPVDPLAVSSDYSRLSAGWDWQVLPNWRLRAEAEYTLYDTGPSLYGNDERRIFFSTRFDFR